MGKDKGSLEFPKLDWSFVDNEKDVGASPPKTDSVVDADLSWPTLSVDDQLSSLEDSILGSLKKERAFDLSDKKAPVVVLIARNLAKNSDPGDELSFFFMDKTSREDFRLYAKQSRLSVLFDGAAPDGKGFLFAFAVPEKAKGISFY